MENKEITDKTNKAHSNKSLKRQNPITLYETAWVMALAGTGLGAGVLYLPFAIGAGGFIPIIVLTLFSIPLVYLSHRNLSRACLAPELSDSDIHSLIVGTFPPKISRVLLAVTFLSVFPTLLIYAIGITNITESFIGNQLQLPVPDISLLSAFLISLLVVILAGGEKWLLRVASGMVTPLTVIMLCLAVYLIPFWNLDNLLYVPEQAEIWKVILFGLPVITFSFYHAPMCSIMARGYRERNYSSNDSCSRTDKIHLLSTVLLFVVILFFVVSCLLCLTRAEVLASQHSNLPILSVLANKSGNPWFAFVAPVIAFLSISTSFFGFFLGSVELINVLLVNGVKKLTGAEVVTPKAVHRVSILLAFLGCWISAIGNWSILDAIVGLVAPMMAIVVFFIPLLAIYRLAGLTRFRNPTTDMYVLISGGVVVFSFILSLGTGS
ncbi:amino acid permease [Sansalvadorimonas sp. 2012CJ34-2]|uniref:Amino acid permease n=1 Tax=Parendozoicomonas callyspongiae TaxID=2942213 RepID=A0ABT0PFB2_9GAMM|nr:amino acid permease [Sansalvadorimonas sp. 2012CJ34-2]MCL6270064.1 amino acid permease [Sansalvadorimonas sp. 2012CJ34-2]